MGEMTESTGSWADTVRSCIQMLPDDEEDDKGQDTLKP